MIKILTVVGARPQFVKAAVISRAFIKSGTIKEIIVHTGQHFDKNMSDIFFQEMEIPLPDYQLNINGLRHGAMTGRMLEQIEEIIINERPDYLLVFGDTNSTLAAALAAKKLAVRIIHIEAGVRNFDDYMPEEINRYVVDRLAELNFCCTYLGIENLHKEGFGTTNINSKIFNYGDVMYDATMYYKEKSNRNLSILEKLKLRNGDFVLCTIHRASNTDNLHNLTNIVDGLNYINKQINVVLPLHPRTRSKLKCLDILPDFECIDPVGYLDMLNLLESCQSIITDSGGVVRESYFFKKPSLLLLDKPLWPELVLENACISTKPERDKIVKSFETLINRKIDFSKNIFGRGNSAEVIVNEIIKDYENRN